MSGVPPVILHVQHSWGGGLESWVRDFNNGDPATRQLVLKSIGNWGKFGEALMLYDHVDAQHPLRYWDLGTPIRATDIRHPRYAEALREMIAEFGITHLFVSSLIGHSLELFDTGLPTVQVLHDYYPVCPALNIFFGEVCVRCDGERIERCFKENPHNRFFLNVSGAEWLELRAAYLERIERQRPTLIAPTPSVRHNLLQLSGIDAYRGVAIIPHGIHSLNAVDFDPADHQRLRLLVPGVVSENKGWAILEEALPELCEMADVVFLGCGDAAAKHFAKYPVAIVPSYRRDELGRLIAEHNPHLALLPATVPETFSYTLSELQHLGVPVLATRLGSFADRIQDGDNGFLIEPSAESLVARVREIAADPNRLHPIRDRLRDGTVRGIRDMIDDYYDLVGLTAAEPAASAEGAPPPQRPDLPGARRSARLFSWLLAHHILLHDRIAAAGRSGTPQGRLLLALYRGVTALPRKVLKWLFRL